MYGKCPFLLAMSTTGVGICQWRWGQNLPRRRRLGRIDGGIRTDLKEEAHELG